MTIALIDNGSLEPAAQLNLRAVAAALAERAGFTVQAVSWKHSDRIPANLLDGRPAQTLAPWVRAHLARGEREFVFIPFFISAQGAIGSALGGDLEHLQRETGGFDFIFTDGLARRDAIAGIVVDRVRETIAARSLRQPSLIVVDHGGPSPTSAALRNALAVQIVAELGSTVGPANAASMEGEAHAHNRPLLAGLLGSPGFDRGDVVIAPLFLSPGRHAGDNGDIAQIRRAAESRLSELRCHVADLVGTHPRVADALAEALRTTLSQLPFSIPA